MLSKEFRNTANTLKVWCVDVYENADSLPTRFYRTTLNDAYALVHRALASGNYADIFNFHYRYHDGVETLVYGNGFSAMHDSIITYNDSLYDCIF